jgi:hypothetical protein
VSIETFFPSVEAMSLGGEEADESYTGQWFGPYYFSQISRYSLGFSWDQAIDRQIGTFLPLPHDGVRPKPIENFFDIDAWALDQYPRSLIVNDANFLVTSPEDRDAGRAGSGGNKNYWQPRRASISGPEATSSMVELDGARYPTRSATRYSAITGYYYVDPNTIHPLSHNDVVYDVEDGSWGYFRPGGGILYC